MFAVCPALYDDVAFEDRAEVDERHCDRVRRHFGNQRSHVLRHARSALVRVEVAQSAVRGYPTRPVGIPPSISWIRASVVAGFISFMSSDMRVSGVDMSSPIRLTLSPSLATSRSRADTG